jgi:regulator of sigma E protease
MIEFWSEFWSDTVIRTIWPIVQFILGLGVVVFVHELGHFLAAKKVGIRVERFALGMGPRLIGFQRGETDYCLCAFPVGGYIKMLGQDDFAPQKAPAASEAEEAGGAEEDGGNAEARTSPIAPDPRNYNSKTVGQRLFVISMGVVMNLILAGLLFPAICMIGKDFPAPVIGGTVPHFPAAEAVIQWQDQAPPAEAANGYDPETKRWIGLRAGDRIARIEGGGFFVRLLGEEINHFGTIQMKAALAGRSDRFVVTFDRAAGGKDYTGQAEIGVRWNNDAGAPAFGLSTDLRCVVGSTDPRDTQRLVDIPFEKGDRIVAIDGRAVESYRDIEAAQKSLTGRAVVVQVDRGGEILSFERRPVLVSRSDVHYLKDGTRRKGNILAYPRIEDIKGKGFKDKNWQPLGVPKDHVALEDDSGEVHVLPDTEFAGGGAWTGLDVLGMTPRLRISAVVPGGPADKAGLREGDIITSYADHRHLTVREFVDLCQATEDDKTRITVLQDGTEGSALEIEPDERKDKFEVGVTLGLDQMHPVVEWVRPGSPAARAGIEAEAEIQAVNGENVHSWIDLVEALKKIAASAGEKSVTLTVRNGSAAPREVPLGTLTKDAFDPDDYSYYLFGHVPFQLRKTTIRKGPVAAIGWGLRETCRMVMMAYGSIASLLRGDVSAGQLRGPVGIGQVAVDAAREGLIHLVYLMAFFSALIAVFNFLPLPVLDGGHAAMLIIEKIRGRPLPMKLINGIQMTGLVLLLGLMVVITWRDIVRIFSEMW